MRTAYRAVVLLGLAAIIGNHLVSPLSCSGGVSPEDFAGACAPCPSKK